MSMEFVRYHEVEILLRSFQALQGAKEALRVQIQSVLDVNEDESIESLAFFRNTDGLPPGTNTVPDRTGNIAAGLRKSNKEASEATNEIILDLLLIDAVTRKLEIGLKVLLPDERRTIELRYFNNLNWQEIADELTVSIATVQRHRRAGVERIRVVARITISDYERLTRILNLS